VTSCDVGKSTPVEIFPSLLSFQSRSEGAKFGEEALGQSKTGRPVEKFVCGMFVKVYSIETVSACDFENRVGSQIIVRENWLAFTPAVQLHRNSREIEDITTSN